MKWLTVIFVLLLSYFTYGGIIHSHGGGGKVLIAHEIGELGSHSIGGGHGGLIAAHGGGHGSLGGGADVFTIPIIKHVPVVNHVPVVKNVKVVKHVPVVKHLPVVQHLTVIAGGGSGGGGGVGYSGD
ncbi:hypothetical protein X975_23622, partial [Stegodyphus mimosarum]